MSADVSDRVVRPARGADMDAIADILNWAIVNTWANFSTEPTSPDAERADWAATADVYPWFVVETAAGVVAFARAARWKSRCAYNWSVESTVYVHPDHFRHGHGRAAYERLLDTVRRQGYHSALGGIALPNEASVRLHESLGMTHAGTLRRVGHKFGRWHDVGYWQIQLNEGAPGEIRPAADCV